jgi:hypothetical protein
MSNYDFRLACERGDLEAAKELYNRGFKDPTGLRGACEFGHLEVVMWLNETFPEWTIHDREEYGFRWACGNGHLHVVLYLLEMFPTIDVHARDDYAFRWACGNGYINVAIYLYFEIGNMDIHALNDSAFQLSAEAGHLTVAQWLCGFNGVNVRVHDDKSLLIASRNKFIRIVEWLLEYSPGMKNRIQNDFAFRFLCVNYEFSLFEHIPEFQC